MARQLPESKAIVKVTRNTLQVVCEDRDAKVELILDSLTQFAAIDRRELTNELRDTYVNTICGHKPELSLRQVEKGLASYMETGDRWPWPSSLIEAMEEEV